MLNDAQITKLNATMKAVSSDFSFKIYFDEITEEQLNSLIWVLTFGENYKESKHQHKLGHAKPLGYGSVKLLVTGKHIRTVGRNENGYMASVTDDMVPEKVPAGIDLEKRYVKELLRMSDVNAVGDHGVGYPVGKDRKIFTWFSENRLRADTVKTLPKPTDDDISLDSSIKNERRGAGRTESKEKNEDSEVVITRIQPNNKNPLEKVGYFDGGMVFKLGEEVKVRDKVVVQITKRTDKKIFANYIRISK